MAEEKTLEYMGKTLLRNGNTVFYGDRNTGIWLQITILETVKVSELDLATKVLLQIVDHNKGKATILKQAEKKSRNGVWNVSRVCVSGFRRNIYRQR